MIGPDVHVAHGYTMEDLRQITAAALVADRLLAMPYNERHDIAWSAIAEHLCAADEPPLRQELVRVGWQAIYHHIRDGLRQRGWSDGGRDRTAGMPTMPRFATYWHGTRVESPQEERLVEELAVTQVLSTLTPAKREAIVALAVHDDYRLAAASLGIAYEALLQRLKMARAQVLKLWHEGETPRRVHRTDRRVGSYKKPPATHCTRGHEWTAENTRTATNMVRGKLQKRRFCRACERARHADAPRSSRETV